MPRPEKLHALPDELEECMRRHRFELQALFTRIVTELELRITETPSEKLQAKGTGADGQSELRKRLKAQHNWEISDEKSMAKLTDEAPRLSLKSEDAREFHVQEMQQASWQERVLMICSSYYFDRFFAVVIILNSIMVAVSVEYAAMHLTDNPPPSIQALQLVFLALFVVEITMRMIAYGVDFLKGPDWGWNIFDSICVFSSILESIFSVSAQGSEALMIARFLRIVRITRVIRLIRFFRQLRVMVVTILHTLSSLFYCTALMAAFIYMFAVCFTQAALFHLMELEQRTEYPSYRDDLVKHWGHLANSFWTLSLSVSSGLSWGEAANTLSYVSPVYCSLFIFYLCFMMFCMFNVITGFFCNDAIDMASADKEEMVAEQMRNKEKYMEFFRSIFSQMDLDGSGTMTFNELEVFMTNARFQAYLGYLKIDVSHAWTIFRLIDKDNSGVISVEEFIGGLLRLRGFAKTVDMKTVHHDLHRTNMVLSQFMDFAEDRLVEIENVVLDLRDGMQT
mmetsp:Transcript_4747/g.8401  ORF Transcript_4747/g.8401 Transcript_4747/m.8401 type:complete len:509 (-) Transcript_4747:108-1634(-)